MMSGHRVERFREGWAIKIMTWGKAHYFRRNEAGFATALCGGQKAPAGALWHAGTFTHCKRCQSRVYDRARAAIAEAEAP